MNSETKTPISFWIISGLSLLWNAFGAFDYTMTQTKNAQYLAAFTPEQRAYFDSFPAWMDATWALGVWGALAGSVLLLLRNHHAVTAFGLSLVGLLVSSIWQFGVAEVKASEIMPPEAMYITIFIWVVAIALFFYARKKRSAGALR